LLEQESARRASDSPSKGEGKRVNPLEVKATGKYQKRQHLRACKDSARSTEVEESFEDSRREAQEE
jgi:hypothetical protein